MHDSAAGNALSCVECPVSGATCLDGKIKNTNKSWISYSYSADGQLIGAKV